MAHRERRSCAVLTLMFETDRAQDRMCAANGGDTSPPRALRTTPEGVGAVDSLQSERLYLPGESKRLSKEDWEPEAIQANATIAELTL